MKNKLVLFITGCFALVLSSCLKSEDITDIELVKNCQISSFKLSSDSISGLDTVKFTIDQLTGRVFNIDSLPYGTKVEKVLCTITAASNYSLSGIEVSPSAYKDSIYYLNNLSDSIDFSAPVKFVVHAYDKVTTKVYMAQVNVHQVVPDSMVWSMYANPMLGITVKDQKVVTYDYKGSENYFMYVKPAESGKPYQLYYAPVSAPKGWQSLSLAGLPSEGLLISQITEYNNALYVPASNGTLYRSEDGLTWSAVDNTPSVKYILGSVEQGAKQPSALATIVDREGKLAFCAMNESMEWIAGDAVPSGFPVAGFSNLQYAAMYHEYLMIAGGRAADNQMVNTTWATMNGTSWALMASGDANFTKREGAMIAHYDDRFFLIGGIDASNKALKDMYQSIDYGISWSLIDSMVVLPTGYAARGFSSIIVDKENFVNIFGGKTSTGSNDLNQLWRGRINRLIPKE
ncbi:MAG: DUF6242 domain-containing protein [Parabacteroides sp.]|nr:DUF6242 domain-containing protein [Parabacteroides sp.]